MVDRLIGDFLDGSNTFSKNGESLWVLARDSHTIAVGVSMLIRISVFRQSGAFAISTCILSTGALESVEGYCSQSSTVVWAISKCSNSLQEMRSHLGFTRRWGIRVSRASGR